MEYHAIDLLGATNSKALGVVARVALRRKHDTESHILAPDNFGRLLARCYSLENIGNIAIDEWQHNLGLGVTKSSIKLDNLHSIRGFHQTTIEYSCKWTTLLDHSLCSRTHNLLHRKSEILVGDEWQRCVGTHTARIRALVAIESTLVILRYRHRVDILTLHKAHQRELRTCQEVLHNHSALAKAVIQEHIAQRFTSLIHSLGNNHALTCCQAIILQNRRQWTSLDIGYSLVVVVECLISSGWDIVLGHQLLGKLLRGFDACCRLRMTENFESLLAELVGNTYCQSSLGTHYGQVDGVILGKCLQALDIGVLDSHALGLCSDTGITRCAIYLIYARRTEQRIDNSVLTTTRAND